MSSSETGWPQWNATSGDKSLSRSPLSPSNQIDQLGTLPPAVIFTMVSLMVVFMYSVHARPTTCTYQSGRSDGESESHYRCTKVTNAHCRTVPACAVLLVTAMTAIHCPHLMPSTLSPLSANTLSLNAAIGAANVDLDANLCM